jgi:hypothetical protein
MHFIVAVTEFTGCYSFFRSFGFRGSAVFIGAANIESLIAAEPAKPGEYIGGKNLN